MYERERRLEVSQVNSLNPANVTTTKLLTINIVQLYN